MISEHLIIAPILIPFVVGALMLLYDDRQRQAKFWLSLVSVAAQLLIAVELVVRAKTGGDISDAEGISFYLLGDWAAPFGIVLVLDRLAAMMLVLTALLAIPSLVYSGAGWARQGPHYYSLFQFLLVGLNGAFLTGDIFNLFVFFEILLAASYGLLLHGSGQLRVRAGLHYIAINLAASLLFLIGVALIYGVTGTLNMAHLANLISAMPGEDRPLLHAGVAILAIAFLVKAGSWPLNFWLPTAYMAAAAPVGAMFAIMTKVGVYAILRLAMLLQNERFPLPSARVSCCRGRSLASRSPGCSSVLLLIVGPVSHRTHQLLNDVFQRHDANDCAVFAYYSCHVAGVLTHAAHRHIKVFIKRYFDELAHVRGIQWRAGGWRGGIGIQGHVVQHVLDVDVADPQAVVSGHGEAGEAGFFHSILHIRDHQLGSVLLDNADVSGRNQHFAQSSAGAAQRIGQSICLGRCDEPLGTRFRDHAGQL